MTVVSQKFYRTCLVAALSVAVFNFGCAKKPISAPPPARTEAPAPRPTVTFQANPTSINTGDTTTLSWSTTNATQVAIAPEVGPVAAEGSTKVTPADSATYTLTATGPGGSADASVRITIATPAATVEPSDADRDIDRIFKSGVQDAYFDLDKADIRADARTALSKTAEILRNYPQIKATIEGHCDERGSTEYNLGLGDRRASAVKQYLVSLGISADRLSTVSYGKEKPFCMEATEACYQQNRRGHFVRAN